MIAHEFIALSLEKKIKLETLHLEYITPFNAAQWNVFGNALAQCSSLTSFKISGAEVLSHEDWLYLGKSFARNKNLKRLDLSSHKLGHSSTETFKAIQHLLEQCPTLMSLDLDKNDLHELFPKDKHADRGKLSSFQNMLASCPNLKELSLKNNHLSRLYYGYCLSLFRPSPWSAFTKAIAQSNTIQSLDCDDFGGERGNAIKAILARNSQQLKSKRMLLVENAQSSLQERLSDESKCPSNFPLAEAIPILSTVRTRNHPPHRLI